MITVKIIKLELTFDDGYFPAPDTDEKLVEALEESLGHWDQYNLKIKVVKTSTTKDIFNR